MAAQRSEAPGFTEAKRRQLVGLALVCMCLLQARATLTRGDFISDDAWISMRYAQNLVNGDGLVWNAGEPPVEGYSNLLWTLLGALGLAVHVPLLGWLTALGLGMAAACVPLTYAAVRLAGGARPWALFGAALTAVSSQIAGTAILGLETPLVVLLMTLSTVRALAEERALQEGRAAFPWSALCFGLLTWGHVEGPFYLAIPVAIRLARRYTAPDMPADRRRDAIAWALMLAFPLSQELFRIFYYHDWMPNTVRIKVMIPSYDVSPAAGLRYVLISLLSNKALAALVALGVPAALLARRGERWIAAGLLLPWLACAAFVVAAKGDMINQLRFMAPAAPTLLAVCAIGLERLIAAVPGPLRLGALCVPLGLGLAIAHRDLSIQVVIHNRNPSTEQQGSGGVLADLREPLGEVRELKRPLARLWSADEAHPLEAVPWFMMWVLENVPAGRGVLFPDVGLLGFALSDGLVLDARGLNSRGSAALLAATPQEGPQGMADPGVVAFLREFHEMTPAGLVLQAKDGRVWGPTEAALQGDGALDAYRSVATGRYINRREVWIGSADLPRPTVAQILARYHRMERHAPGILDWASRARAIERGSAVPAETPWLDSEPIELYPSGVWTREATGRPHTGR